MTDFHIHLLPCMDDGAQSVSESFAMLEMLAEQGVAYAVCTPHYYGENERAEHFLARRAESYAQISGHAAKVGVRLALGAEIAMWHGMSAEVTDQLCLGDSNLLLCELPVSYAPWVIDEIEELGALGFCPVIAHLDRVQALYTKEQLMAVLECHGTVYQFNAASLTKPRVRQLLRAGQTAVVLGSDGHGAQYRAPDLGGVSQALAGFRMRDVRARIEKGDARLTEAIF